MKHRRNSHFMSQSRRVRKDEFKYVKGERKASEVETQFEMDSP